jgi:intracellular multiplication protein IcmP
VKFVQFSHLPLPIPSTENLMKWFFYVQSKPGAVNFKTLSDVSFAVGKYFSYPVAVILVLFAILAYRSNLTSKFKTAFDMKRLKKLEETDWPQIAPVAKLNLIKQDLTEGPWAMAMTPMQFCKHHNLLKVEKDEEQGRTLVTLLTGSTHRIFALQLGPVWLGVEKLPIHAQALFAIFAARANRDREGSDKLLSQISASSLHGKLDFTGTPELLTKHANTKLVKQVVKKHAYALTVMASMLELGRTDGVLASAEFLWLKPVDRKLWYMLNSIGRQTAVPEIAGTFAHWNIEKKIGRPLKVPMVDEAVKGLDAALKEIIYEPEEE